MKLKNQYYLMRHGQNIYQVSKRPWIYPDFNNDNVFLNKTGKDQVLFSAKKLKKENIDFVFSSDFKRTKQTAGIITRVIKKKVVFDKRLRDVDLGIWHGHKKEEFYKLFPEFSRKLFYKRPEKGESWPDCQRRMKEFLKKLEGKYKNRKILIISHGDPLWLLEGYIKGYSRKFLADNKKKIFLKTGSFKKF